MKLLRTAFNILASDTKWLKFLTNISGILGILTVLYALYFGYSKWITPTKFEFILASITFILCLSSIVYTYVRLQSTFLARKYPTDYTILSHKSRIKYAIRLSYIDPFYFVSLIWLKATRAFLMFSTLLLLFTLQNISLHKHNNTITIFDVTIVTHNILDFTVIIAIISLGIATALNAYETHAIAAGVCRIRINKYLVSRRS